MILIIDYKAGNLTSVKRALDYLEIPNRFVKTGEEGPQTVYGIISGNDGRPG